MRLSPSFQLPVRTNIFYESTYCHNVSMSNVLTKIHSIDASVTRTRMTDYDGDFHVTAPLTYTHGFSGDLRSNRWQLSYFSQTDRAKYLSGRSKGGQFGEFERAYPL